jgi:hypothetical protein
MASKSKYRSKFEEGLGAILEPSGGLYEPYSVVYQTPSTYTPDFVFKVEGTKEVLVEAKGWFRPGDQKKYKCIRDCLEVGQELVFILQSPNKKVRKGALLTMAGWCEKEGIKSFASAEELLKYVNA